LSNVASVAGCDVVGIELPFTYVRLVIYPPTRAEAVGRNCMSAVMTAHERGARFQAEHIAA
jgi:hypothetical protein